MSKFKPKESTYFDQMKIEYWNLFRRHPHQLVRQILFKTDEAAAFAVYICIPLSGECKA